MPTLAADHIQEVTHRILAAAGAGPEEAQIVAASLVRANLVGHDSHGIIRLPQYVAAVQEGRIVPGAPVEVVAETPASACLDGHWGFGPPIGHRAVEVALAKARQVGVAAVTVRRASHMGRMGEYVEAVARQEAAGLLFCNVHGAGVCTVPWGGVEARLGTNPLAAGLPRPPGGALVLDMATSAVAEGKVRVLRNRGEAAPEGWLLDGHGQPSTDPAALYDPDCRGSLLPFGGRAGYKGYGLNVVIDLLAGALSGAGTSRGAGGRLGNAILLLVVDVAHFVPLDDFAAAIDELERFIKSSAPAPGYDEILMPGDVEDRCAHTRATDGIFVDAETWAQVGACARRVGTPLPDGP